MSEEETKQPREGFVRVTPGVSMRDMMGPLGADQAIRQAVHQCWMMLPEGERSLERVEQEVSRLFQRVLKDLREDSAAFGFTKTDVHAP